MAWAETRSESMISLGHGRRPTARRHDRRNPGRAGDPLPTRHPAGLRRFGRGRRRARNVHDPADGLGRVRHRQHRVPGTIGRHQHHADRRLPRCRPAGGDGSDRAGHRPVRRRARTRSGGDPPAQPDRPVRRSARDGDRSDLRRRRLRRRPRPGPRRRRLRRVAGGAAATSRIRRLHAARHRRQHVRGDHQQHPRQRDGADRSRRGRQRRRVHRHLATRPGPRDGMGDDRRRANRPAGLGDHASSGATPISYRPAAARWAHARCRSAAPRSTPRRPSSSTSPAASPPISWKRTSPTSSSTPHRGTSTSPAHRP